MLRVAFINRVGSVSSKQSRSDYTLGHRPGGSCVRNIQIKDMCTVWFFRTRAGITLSFYVVVAACSCYYSCYYVVC